MINIDQRQLNRLADNLGDLQLKFAERDTINSQAFATQRNAREHIGREMINRNTWTKRSVRVDTARSLNDSALVGSTERYMAHQEFGHTDTQHTSIAKPAASGESPRAAVRRKVVRRANRMSSIALRGRKGGGKAANIAALHEAKAAGRKFVLLARGRDKGIYRVMGTRRKPKARKVQDLSRRVAVIPRNPWLLPSTVSAEETRRIFFAQMRRQLRRMR